MTVNERVPLARLGEITAGPSGSLLERLRDGPDGIPVISPPDLTDLHTVDTQRVRRVPQDDATKLIRFALQEGDLLVVRQGTLGRLALIGPEHATWFYSSSCLRIRPHRELILPAYLASYLSSPQGQRYLLGQALPGTVPSLNSAMLKELPVIVPTIEQQRAVVEVLADIDTLIGIQRNMTDRLVEMRPAIFEDMIKGTRRSCID